MASTSTLRAALTEAHVPQTSPSDSVGVSPPAGVVRRLFWLLPEPLKRRLSHAYDILRPSPPERIVFPPDVADKAAPRSY